MRTVSWTALLIALACATFTATAGPGPLSSVSADGLLAIAGAVLFSLIAGYTKGQERRITVLEHEQKQQQSQINLLRADFLRDHPSRPEFTDLREDMRNRFDRIEGLLRVAANLRSPS